jgi:hypothetical protein
MLYALQLARQVPCLFSVEGTSVSISRPVALRRYPAFARSVTYCDNLANQGRFG